MALVNSSGVATGSLRPSRIAIAVTRQTSVQDTRAACSAPRGRVMLGSAATFSQSCAHPIPAASAPAAKHPEQQPEGSFRNRKARRPRLGNADETHEIEESIYTSLQPVEGFDPEESCADEVIRKIEGCAREARQMKESGWQLREQPRAFALTAAMSTLRCGHPSRRSRADQKARCLAAFARERVQLLVMGFPAFPPELLYVCALGSGEELSLLDLCELAGAPFEPAQGALRRVRLVPVASRRDSYVNALGKHEDAEVGVPPGTRVEQAQWALCCLAYSELFDPIARKACRGQAWAAAEAE